MLNAQRKTRTAFTLVELMLSIAVALILILGVSSVFKVVGTTVGANQALSDGVRDSRAAQNIFYRDFNFAMESSRMPCLILSSHSLFAFRNQADRLGDANGDPRDADVDGTGVETTVLPTSYGLRNHRIDTFSMFAQDLYTRQTGNDGVLTADMTSNEAWIWYGHLWQPDNNLNFSAATLPGAGTPDLNPNNFYSTQWVLGRVAMLLRDPSSGMNDKNNVAQHYVSDPSTSTGLLGSVLEFGSNSDDGKANYLSRYDLVGTTANSFKTALAYWITTNAVGTNWWDALFATYDRRFQASVKLVKPISAASYARQSPIFMPNCSQFIVEYAGDFLTQDPTTGLVTALVPDGHIDFILSGASQRIRWYGMPRNVDVTDDVGGPVIRGTGPAGSQIDVVPLRDVAGAQATFERTVPAAPLANYATAGAAVDYVCAWAPADTKPAMIRITLVIDDPGGRIAEGQSFEYVFKLP